MSARSHPSMSLYTLIDIYDIRQAAKREMSEEVGFSEGDSRMKGPWQLISSGLSSHKDPK